MKRLDTFESSAYIAALFSDLEKGCFYTKASESRRDQSRLSHELEVNGLRVLTIDLPALCKHFDKCLAAEQYTPMVNGYLSSSRRRVLAPQFLGDLYLQVFDESGKLRKDPDVNAILAIRQVYKGLSKLRLMCNTKEINDEVLNFSVIEEGLRMPTFDWSRVDFDPFNRKSISFCDLIENNVESDGQLRLSSLIEGSNPNMERDRIYLRHLQQVADRISSSLGNFYYDFNHNNKSPLLLPKHGTGRVSDASRISSKYSFPFWPLRLERCFPYEHYGVVNYNVYDLRDTPIPVDEQSSKLIAVPKTMKGPRLIASEPTSYQWCQQLVWGILRERIQSSPLKNCVSFHDQGANRSLALEGSLNKRWATVDLSSASDRLSLWTLERAFRKNGSLLDRIQSCRSMFVRNGINSTWKYIFLRKAFSQGNACTFPVQSVVYSIVAIAADILSRGVSVNSKSIEYASKNVRVFGDDIIIRPEAFGYLVTLLELLQLKVNHDKSFEKGSFRESCGIDAFMGHDVTPTYIKSISKDAKHEKAISALEASNNLHRSGWWNLAKWQSSLICQERKFPVVHNSCTKIGLITFSPITEPVAIKRRWNSDLQKEEILVPRLISNSRKSQSKGYDELFQYFIERPSPTTKWSGGFIVESKSVLRFGWDSTEQYLGNTGI